jgi:protoporphyrinogen oxidase
MWDILSTADDGGQIARRARLEQLEPMEAVKVHGWFSRNTAFNFLPPSIEPLHNTVYWDHKKKLQAESATKPTVLSILMWLNSMKRTITEG